MLRGGCEVAGIDCDGRRITGVTVQGAGGGPSGSIADHYVAALPVERLRLLLSPALRAAEPRLAALPRLVVRWMNGAMFYLDRDVPLQHGHAIFIDSEWALTAISQAQFWPDVDLRAARRRARRGDPLGRRLRVGAAGAAHRARSRWPARRTRSARRSGGSSSTTSTTARSTPRTCSPWFLDPAIQFPNPTGATNLEPLLINTAGSWADRPDAVTRIPNLFLAADFVRTHTDLATMEGANEAARRAVNGILEATGSSAPRCALWKLREPGVLAPFRALDRVRWRLGRRPAQPPVRVTMDGELEPTGPVARGLLAVARRFG